jgi:hypothetical protein
MPPAAAAGLIKRRRMQLWLAPSVAGVEWTGSISYCLKGDLESQVCVRVESPVNRRRQREEEKTDDAWADMCLFSFLLAPMPPEVFLFFSLFPVIIIYIDPTTRIPYV